MRTVCIAIALLTAAAVGFCAEMSYLDVPMKGDRQVYSVVEETGMAFEGTPVKMSSRGTGTRTGVCAGVSKAGDASVFTVLTTQAMKIVRQPTGAEENSTSYTLDCCRQVPSGLFQDSNYQYEDGKDASVDLGRTMMILKFPCTTGTTWNVGRLGFKDGYSMRPVAKAVGYETVDTPAGKFENCLKVETTCPNGIEGYVMQDAQKLEIVSSEASYTTWYYPVIGTVKEVSQSLLRLRPEGQEAAAVLNMTTRTVTELTEHRESPRPPAK